MFFLFFFFLDCVIGLWWEEESFVAFLQAKKGKRISRDEEDAPNPLQIVVSKVNSWLISKEMGGYCPRNLPKGQMFE